MQDKPYFCPNCRANRVRFKTIRREAQVIQKDAFDGNILSQGDPETFSTIQGDTEVQCLSCNFVGYENMFIKMAEREPRYR